jgi:hypothetical protein
MSIKRFDDYCEFYRKVCEDGRLVYYDDHATAIAAKDDEIADLSRKLDNVADAYMRSITERNRLQEEVKNLNHMLDKAQVLRGEDADRFLDRMETVDRGEVPKSCKKPGIDTEKLHRILEAKRKEREESEKRQMEQPAPRYDDVYIAGVEALDKM